MSKYYKTAWLLAYICCAGDYIDAGGKLNNV